VEAAGVPSISVVIPCYNGEGFLAAAIQSVQRQTSPPLEVIVVDDGSTDHTRQVASRFPVRVLSHGRNRGVAAARNTGLAQARGEIIAYLDSDCEAAPTNLERIAAAFSEEDVVAVGGQEFDGDRRTVYDRYRLRFYRQSLGPRYLRSVPSLPGHSFSFRTRVLREVGGFRSPFLTAGEDIDTTWQLHRRGFRLVYDPEIRVFHHRTEGLRGLHRTVWRWTYYATLAHNRPTLSPDGTPRSHDFARRRWGILREIGQIPPTEEGIGSKAVFVGLLVSTTVTATLARTRALRDRQALRGWPDPV
jgi:glycosyltransferase involved in cell wall biosynthesis